MSAEVARILRAAADLIEPPGRWTQCAVARDSEGHKVTAHDPDAVSWCGAGAIRRAAGHYEDVAAAMNAWRDQVGEWLVGCWNDDKVRTAEEVVAALRAAADVEAQP